MSAANGNTRVEQMTQEFVAKVKAEARAEVVAETQGEMAQFAAEFVQRFGMQQGRMDSVPQPIQPPSIAGGKPLSHAKLMHPHCDYPGCTNAHNGPKYRWLCREHRTQWKTVQKLKRKAEREAARADRAA